jgi:hypothetical protein
MLAEIILQNFHRTYRIINKQTHIIHAFLNLTRNYTDPEIENRRRILIRTLYFSIMVIRSKADRLTIERTDSTGFINDEKFTEKCLHF